MPTRSHLPKDPTGTIPPRLSSAEWELMELCWRLCPAPVERIHTESKKTKDRDYNTVSTLLKRMEVKGWLKFDRNRPKPYEVKVLVDRTTALLVEVDLFLDEIVGEDLDTLRIVEERVVARRRSLLKGRK